MSSSGSNQANANTNARAKTRTNECLDTKLFLAAQRRMYSIALGEIRDGKKTSHWIWYIFPQISGLGMSDMSKTYAIPSMKAAKEYLAHNVLGARLHEITQAVLDWDARHKSVKILMGSTTDMEKLKSCMTLFWWASDRKEELFKKVLDKYYEGEADKATEERLFELSAEA
ncbi:hypothetical protein DL770_001465 [Monosporascus sp. CRB-9-2]|nr:hypothetical protein DL770_001465 [Monosporascus sp. CRB-9-2]